MLQLMWTGCRLCVVSSYCACAGRHTVDSLHAVLLSLQPVVCIEPCQGLECIHMETYGQTFKFRILSKLILYSIIL